MAKDSLMRATAPKSPWKGKARSDKTTDERKTAILEEAANLFYSQGYHETTLNQIAERLHITKPTAYYYVKSKQDCLLDIVRISHVRIGQAIELAHRAEGSGREKAVLFMRKYAEFITTPYGKCLAIGVQRALEEPHKSEVETAERGANRRIMQLIRLGISDGSIADIDPMVVFQALIGSMNWIAWWYQPGGRLPTEAFVNAHIEFLINGLKPR